ncbi:MAG: hypothetical protein KGR99_08750 [Betaproteobacteria bacterium]|nr:hypothetical protein [Betaproteobacteria bacterium]
MTDRAHSHLICSGAGNSAASGDERKGAIPFAPFVRRPKTFPGEDRLERYSSCTILPTQLMRVLGFHPTVLRDEAFGESQGKLFMASLMGGRRLSERSRAILRPKLGELAEAFFEAGDFGRSAKLDAQSPWSLLESMLSGNDAPTAQALMAGLKVLAEVEQVRADAAGRTTVLLRPQERDPFQRFVASAVERWAGLLTGDAMLAAPVLESSAMALAALDASLGQANGFRTSCVAAIVRGERNPMDYWMALVCAAYGARTKAELARVLARKRILHSNGQRPFSRDLLAKWACGSRLPDLTHVHDLVRGVPEKADSLFRTHVLVRGVAFFLEVIRSLATEEITEALAKHRFISSYAGHFSEAISKIYPGQDIAGNSTGIVRSTGNA